MSTTFSPFFFFLCFSDARLELSDDDAAVALALTECSARSYSELLRSDAPSSSGLKSAKSSALKSSPSSSLGVFPSGPAAAAPTRGEILIHLEGIARKPRSAKRKRTGSPKRDQPVRIKVRKLEAPSSPLSERPERSPPTSAEVPLPPSSEPVAETGSPTDEGPAQPLAALPITVWKAPSEDAKTSPGKSPTPTGGKTKISTAENKDSLLFSAKLAARAVSSILEDSDIARSKELPVDEVLASSFQGLASVSL